MDYTSVGFPLWFFPVDVRNFTAALAYRSGNFDRIAPNDLLSHFNCCRDETKGTNLTKWTFVAIIVVNIIRVDIRFNTPHPTSSCRNVKVTNSYTIVPETYSFRSSAADEKLLYNNTPGPKQYYRLGSVL